MKKYTSFKVLQLAILAILTILSLFLLLKKESGHTEESASLCILVAPDHIPDLF